MSTRPAAHSESAPRQGPATLAQLDTPALVLDRARVERNTAAMAAHVESLGVALRPHLKTAKCAEVARMALGHPSPGRPVDRAPGDRAPGSGAARGGLTVATLHEAEFLAARGFRDLVYAVCLSPDKLPRAAALVDAGVRLGLLTDDIEVAAALARLAAPRAAAGAAPLDVLVEIDVGEHRTGVEAESEELLTIARTIHAAAGLALRGVLSHAGHSYACRDAAAITAVAEDERRLTVRAAARVRAAGLPCPDVSAGSTPTAHYSRDASGLTEYRPGVYTLGDLFQASIGTCSLDDIAVSVLATVIGRRPEDGRFVIDAGGLGLSKDRSTADSVRDCGYGLLLDVDGTHLHEGVHVVSVHQEHGEVQAPAPLPPSHFPVGSRVRVLPNHACMTAAMYDRYHVVDGPGQDIIDVWERGNGWAPLG